MARFSFNARAVMPVRRPSVYELVTHASEMMSQHSRLVESMGAEEADTFLYGILATWQVDAATKVVRLKSYIDESERTAEWLKEQAKELQAQAKRRKKTADSLRNKAAELLVSHLHLSGGDRLDLPDGGWAKVEETGGAFRIRFNPRARR